MAEAHHRAPGRHRRPGDLLQSGHHHPMAARRAEVLSPMSAYTLKIRRYDPSTGHPPYWEDHGVDLEGHRSILDGILDVKAREDGSIGIRCSCQAAICGSCGVRVNGKASLACNTKLRDAV